MQIVIDIPNWLYNAIIECKEPHYSKSLGDAVRDGTPLPKGHKRLIEDNFDTGPVFDKEGYMIGYRYVIQEDLNNAPTIVEADKEGE